MKVFVAALLLMGLTGFSAKADDAKAEALFADAKAEFAKRVAFGKDELVVEMAIQQMELALTEVVSLDLRFQILNYSARVLTWKGLHTKLLKPEQIYEAAMKRADEARALDKKAYGKYAEGNYWYAVALGRWALEKGPLTVLGRKGELMSSLDATVKSDTLNGDLGETYEGYGADRIASRMYLELPGLAGGDKKKALKHAETAYTNAPEYTLNGLYYAQALEANDQTDKACEVLAAAVMADVTVLPERTQDAQEDIADIKKFQAEICVK